MTGRAKRDEVTQVEGCATVRHGLAVVNLESNARAAFGTASTIPGEHGRPGPLPPCRGADQHSGLTCGATGARSVPFAAAARATLALIGTVERGATPGA